MRLLTQCIQQMTRDFPKIGQPNERKTFVSIGIPSFSKKLTTDLTPFFSSPGLTGASSLDNNLGTTNYLNAEFTAQIQIQTLGPSACKSKYVANGSGSK